MTTNATTTAKIRKAPPTTRKPKHPYREQWLHEAMPHVTALFEEAGYEVPENIRITCGWPSQKALGARSRRIGECWDTKCSDDKAHEIIVSLFLADPMQVLGVLVHEVVHAVVGVKHGHKAPFVKCMTAVGLTGKPTATTEGPELKARIAKWIKALGPYPHAKLDGMKGQKKQTTRLLKMKCNDCECTIRTTSKWIDQYGDKWECPCGGDLMTDTE